MFFLRHQPNRQEAMKTVQTVSIATLPALFFAMNVLAEDAVLDRLHLKPGQAFELKHCFGANAGLPGFTNSFAEDYLLEVIDVANNRIGIRLTCQRIKVFFPLQGNYDSEKRKAPPQDHADLSAMIDSALLIDLRPDGTVLKVSGFDAVAQRLKESLGIEETPKLQTQRENLDRMLQDLFQHLGGTPNPDGTSWTRQGQTTISEKVDVKNTYTLTGVKDGIATLKLASEIAPKKQPTYTLNPSQSGTCRVEVKTGLPTRIELKQVERVTTRGFTHRIRIDHKYTLEPVATPQGPEQ